MLVIANGAFRSGSTWIANILRSMIEYSVIPEKYDNTKAWGKGRSIHPRNLKMFLEEVDFSKTHYISKNHFGKRKFRNIILNSDDVVVINVQRDLKDAVTSGYYYFCRRGEFSGNFKDYYWERGRYVADSLRNYHVLWEVNSQKVFSTSYEKVKKDFTSEVKKLGSFLGYTLSDNDVERIKEETNINRLRKKWNEENKGENDRFFRKGIVGDWRNHFDDEMLDNIKLIEKKGLNSLERFALKVKIKFLTVTLSLKNKLGCLRQAQ